MWGGRDAGDLGECGGQASLLPPFPPPPPEQCGPQALVEASDAPGPKQVPGQLSSRGPGGGRSLHGGLGAPLGRQLGLGIQYLLLGSWGEKGWACWLPDWGRGCGSGCHPPQLSVLPPHPHQCGLRPEAGSSASPWGWSQSPGRCQPHSPPASPSPGSASACGEGVRTVVQGRPRCLYRPGGPPAALGVKETGNGEAARRWRGTAPANRGSPFRPASNGHRAQRTDGPEAGPGKVEGPQRAARRLVFASTRGAALPVPPSGDGKAGQCPPNPTLGAGTPGAEAPLDSASASFPVQEAARRGRRWGQPSVLGGYLLSGGTDPSPARPWFTAPHPSLES